MDHLRPPQWRSGVSPTVSRFSVRIGPMRRSTIFVCVVAAGYLLVVCLVVFGLAPTSMAVADFVASAGIALPHPAGWNLAVFTNGGSPALHITVTGVLAIFGYGALVGGCGFFAGEYQDAKAALGRESAGGGRAESASGSVPRAELLGPTTEGEGFS